MLWADLPTMARPFVKWSAEVHRARATCRALVHRAAKTALAPPTGPVFLSLPGDILKAEGDLDLVAPTRVAPRVRGDADAIAQAAALLAQAKRPVIIAGDAVAQSRAHAELVAARRAARRAGLCRGHAEHARRSRPRTRCSAARSRAHPAAVRQVLDQHDLLFSVGGDLFTLSLPSDDRADAAGHARSSTSTPIPGSSARTIPAEVAILGDPKATLPELTAAIESAMTERRARRARASGSRPPATRRSREARRAQGQGQARSRAQVAGAAAGAAATRSATMLPQRRGRDRGGALVRRPACASSSAATTRRASSACAAAASAGACRRRSASSSRCRTGRWWR